MSCATHSLTLPRGSRPRICAAILGCVLAAQAEAHQRDEWMEALLGHWAPYERSPPPEAWEQDGPGHRDGTAAAPTADRGPLRPLESSEARFWASPTSEASQSMIGLREVATSDADVLAAHRRPGGHRPRFSSPGRLKHVPTRLSRQRLFTPGAAAAANSYRDLSDSGALLEADAGLPLEAAPPRSRSMARAVYDSVKGFANQTFGGLFRMPAGPSLRWLGRAGEATAADGDGAGEDDALELSSRGWRRAGLVTGNDESVKDESVLNESAPDESAQNESGRDEALTERTSINGSIAEAMSRQGKNRTHRAGHQGHRRAGILVASTKENQTYVQQCPEPDKDQEPVYLTADDLLFAQCPPGRYTGLPGKHHRRARSHRLQQALCAAKSRGWRGGNNRETSAFRQRGYATFESKLWPKPNKCRKLPNEAWSFTHAKGRSYRPDAVPVWMSKWVNKEAKLEFHQNWKVASTSFPGYLQCNFDGKWQQVPAGTAPQDDVVIAAAVREPIGRFISAISELLERAVNHWCPQGPCGPADSFKQGVTVSRMKKQTTWLDTATNGINETNHTIRVHRLMKAFVTDTSCNYYTYACEHLSSQSNFVTQNAGIAKDISVVVKLEDLNTGLSALSSAAGLAHNKSCVLAHSNMKVDKPSGDAIPSSEDMLRILEGDENLIQQLCLVYAQDFICFDYDLPDACKGMF